MFKRIIVVLLLVVLPITLAGCIPVTLDTDYEIYQSVDQIQSIKLYKRLDVEMQRDTPLAELTPENWDAFVTDLEDIYAWDGFYLTIGSQDPSFDFGYKVVVISYKDGVKEYISNFGYQEIRSDDALITYKHYSINDEQWDALLRKYFFIYD